MALRTDDSILEVRSSGAGHDAKVFDAFLLSRPDARPVLLGLGKQPSAAKAATNPAVQVRLGVPTTHPGADSITMEKDEVQVLHQGFGAWGVTYRFDLSPPIPPGTYRVFARYKSGGEVSQVAQSFMVQAGPNLQDLGTRGSFALTNTTPWEYQWLKAESAITVLPGDTVLQIENFGKADGAKVFDAFLLQMETALGGWMNPTEAQRCGRKRQAARRGQGPSSDRENFRESDLCAGQSRV